LGGLAAAPSVIPGLKAAIDQKMEQIAKIREAIDAGMATGAWPHGSYKELQNQGGELVKELNEIEQKLAQLTGKTAED
jgi:hypothetical protein